MKTLKVFTVLLLLCSSVVLAQVAVMGDVQGTALSNTPEKFSTWKLQVRVGINQDLSLTGFFRSSRSRVESVPKPEYSPTDAGLVGIYYRFNPFIRLGISGGLQTRKDPGTKELGWLIGGDLFFGIVSERNYYLKKQVFGYVHLEKGQWDLHPYIDARAMFPLISFLAIGAKFESDLGYGPHTEIKILLGEEEDMKAIYIYGTYFMTGDIKTPVVGIRVAMN